MDGVAEVGHSQSKYMKSPFSIIDISVPSQANPGTSVRSLRRSSADGHYGHGEYGSHLSVPLQLLYVPDGQPHSTPVVLGSPFSVRQIALKPMGPQIGATQVIRHDPGGSQVAAVVGGTV